MTPERWARVKKIFDEALEHEPTSRAAFLDTACQDDAELRAEVEQLLEEDEITGGFLGAPLLPTPAKPLSTGMRLGPYEILSAIGAGGMGEVYRARDTRLKRTVALKVLPQHLWRNAKAHARFEREARAIAALSHPHICALYDIGSQDGINYLVMEYLEGDTLAHRLRNGPLLLEQLFRYGADIVDALEEAHGHGIIHRDLKPSNIMLTKSGAKLLDFGVAKRHRRVKSASTNSTVPLSVTSDSTGEGVLVGTLAYMSPEQARGEGLDVRTDLFSFGAVLYEMATGMPAFSGATPAVIIDALLNRTPAPPRQINPGLPNLVENIISKALDKDRELRYQTAAELGDDLASMRKTKVTRVVTECPYRGLRAFREEDTEFFAGREAFAERLLELALSRKLVAVVGPSGSGKSSVVQAGLVPLLRQQRERTWRFTSFTPGNRPFHRLAAAIMPLLEAEMSETDRLVETQKLANRLATGEVLLEQVVARVLEKSTKTEQLLIIADQFEELFTMTPAADREPFIAAMLAALASASTSLQLVMRADFYGHAIALSRDLSDWLERGVVNLGPMVRAELERALQQPASRVGLEFERGLAERILNDVGAEPGNLPLLEFALTELWERRLGPLLTHQAYEEIGAVAGAIAKRAESEFAKLTPEQQAVAPRVFTRLVHVARPEEGGEDTRQRADLDDMTAEAQELIKALADARLLVTSRDEATGRQMAEVAHEALIRSWQRLGNWVNEDREFLLWRQRLRDAMVEWRRVGQNNEGLLPSGKSLGSAKQWLRLRYHEITEQERTFIEKSAKFARRRKIVTGLSYGALSSGLLTLLSLLLIFLVSRTDRYQVRMILSNAPYQAVTPGSIGGYDFLRALAVVDLARARSIAERMPSVPEELGVSQLGVSTERSWALAAMSESLCRYGNLKEASQLAVQIPLGDRYRDVVLRRIIDILVRTGNYEQAHDIVLQLSNYDHRSDALAFLCNSMSIAGKPIEAERLVPDMNQSDQRMALRSIEEALVKDKKTAAAARLLDESVRMALRIPEQSHRCMALSAISETMVRNGETSEAVEILAQATEVAFQIREQAPRSVTLKFIAETLMRTGKPQQAREIIGNIPVDDRAVAVASIAELLPKLNSSDEALREAEKVHELAIQISDPNYRSIALRALAVSLIQLGKVDVAVKVAMEIPESNATYRNEVVGSMATAAAELGNVNGARRLLNMIPNSDLKDTKGDSMRSVAEALTKVGMADEALNIARQIPDSARALVLNLIAELLIQSGRLEKGDRVLEESEPLADRIAGDDRRSKAFASRARALAKLHRYQEARITADKCSISEDRLSAYGRILAEFAHLDLGNRQEANQI